MCIQLRYSCGQKNDYVYTCVYVTINERYMSCFDVNSERTKSS